MLLNFNYINDILHIKYFIPYYFIYRNVIPQKFEFVSEPSGC